MKNTKKGSILVIEDEPSMRSLLEMALSRAGYDVTTTSTGEDGATLLDNQKFDVVLTDLKLPGISGIDLLNNYKNKLQTTQFVIMTAYATIESAMEAVRSGAFDYVKKPFKLDELELVIWRAVEQSHLMNEHNKLKEIAAGTGKIIAKSQKMSQLLEIIKKISRSKAAVLITGPSGAGKELIAKAIHKLSDRSDKPFIPINCGAIPENLLESELFGYEKGAFTGAESHHSGLFLAADGGTLFLDEIGELPLSLQVKLLRAIQEKAIRTIGGIKEIPVNVRIIAATNKNLEQEIKEGRFREDLFYRLNVIHIEIPPLKERKEDIPQLVDFFLTQLSREAVIPKPTVSNDVLEYFLSYDWPGNVRELENILERALTMDEDGQITMEDLGILKKEHNQTEKSFSLDEKLMEQEKKYILEALNKTGWNRTKAAKLLGISFRSLRYRMEKLGIS